MASYFGSVLVLFLAFPLPFILYVGLGVPAVAKMVDPVGFIAIMNTMFLEWTIVEKNVRMFTLEGPMLWNRLLWLAIGAGTLAFIHWRFRFAHRIAFDPVSWLKRRFAKRSTTTVPGHRSRTNRDHSVPRVRQSFGFATHVRQTLSIAASSFRMIAQSPAGLFLLAVFPTLLVLVVRVETEHWERRFFRAPDTSSRKHLTAPLTYAADYRVIVQLLIVYFAGELSLRERDAGLSENVDATSVPEWVLLWASISGSPSFSLQ